MNERINELRLDAGISRLRDEPKFMVAVSEEGTVIEPLDGLQKFAELIVRECIAQLEIGKRCDPYTGELFSCERNDVIDFEIVNLKEHFGVEE